MTSVRICVCGDEGTGKSSLIVSLVKDTFTTNRIQRVLPTITMPSLGDNVTTTIVDTSARPQDRNTLRKELRKCTVILLMPYFRSLGVNVPVVLCANKSDLRGRRSVAAVAAGAEAGSGDGTRGAVTSPAESSTDGVPFQQVAEEEMLPVMAEFREIDSCVRASAREGYNVAEVFHLCQKAVIHPIAPLFDSRESELKPACVAALRRVFYLCDYDQDGRLSDDEMRNFQARCFEKELPHAELKEIKDYLVKSVRGLDTDGGIDLRGFLHLSKSLSLDDTFLHPKFDVPDYASAELSPSGYKFFIDLFLLFDKDNDGGLNDSELGALYAPTPGLPQLWLETSFPSSTIRNKAGHITLQGWLAQWSMTTFLEPKTTLEYLAYLGYKDPSNTNRGPTTSALKITKARKRRRRPGRVERNVVLCYILGAPGAGKSSLLDTFLNRPQGGGGDDAPYVPTIKPRRAVNSVELPGGRQCYLILEELGELEPAVLDNQARLDTYDLLCFTYDSSDPDSFTHIVELYRRHPQLDNLPAVYTGLKADRDKTTQRAEAQPDAYTRALIMPAPLYVSVRWPGVSELFVAHAERATNPSSSFPKSKELPPDRTSLYIALGAVAYTGLAAFII